MKRVLYVLMLSLAFASCGHEDDLIAPGYEKKGDGNTGTGGMAGNINANTANSEYGRMEFPLLKGGSTNRVIIHKTSDGQLNYAVEWDDSKKAQRWTCYTLTAENTVEAGKRSTWWNGMDPFQEDTQIPAKYRTRLSDYTYSKTGYQRGHICPSYDRLYSKEANEQTFYLSNIQPQLPGFNTGVWATAEQHISNRLDQNTFRDTLYLVKGGTIDNGQTTMASTGLLVPKYFFMAIMRVYKGQYHAIGLWFEHIDNSDKKLAKYALSIDELEEKTGIDFFCNLPDDREKVIESQKNTALWSLN